MECVLGYISISPLNARSTSAALSHYGLDDVEFSEKFEWPLLEGVRLAVSVGILFQCDRRSIFMFSPFATGTHLILLNIIEWPVANSFCLWYWGPDKIPCANLGSGRILPIGYLKAVKNVRPPHSPK